MSQDFDLKSTLIKLGMPAVEAGMVAELSEHAALEAASTIIRIADTAPYPYKAMVTLFASRIVQDSTAQFINDSIPDYEAALILVRTGRVL